MGFKLCRKNDIGRHEYKAKTFADIFAFHILQRVDCYVKFKLNAMCDVMEFGAMRFRAMQNEINAHSFNSFLPIVHHTRSALYSSPICV